MKGIDQKNLLDWFRSQRVSDDGEIHEGWMKRHEIPLGNTEFGFFKPRMMDKTIRDLVKGGYLEGRQVAGKNLKEWRYIPHSDQEPDIHSEEDRAYYSINGYWPGKETSKLI